MTPLLRAPPFPGVDPAIASIDAGATDEAVPVIDEWAAAQAMAAAKVGGYFWRRSVPGKRRLVVLGAGAMLPCGSLDDAVVSSKRRWLGAARRGAVVVPPDVDPWPLIGAAEEVVVPANHEIALLAAAAGRRVIDPDGRPLGEGQSLTTALFGRRYRNPITGELIGVRGAIRLLTFWRTLIDANRGLAAATGMAFWKKREVARLLWDGRATSLPFLKPAAALAQARREGGAVAAWPARVPPNFADQAAAAGVPVRWVEDGFLRSAGLGSDLLPPLSLVVDDLWPYFDPARPSRLEVMLEAGDMDEALIARAAALREKIVARRMGKYHIGGYAGAVEVNPRHERVVLVVGQVEDDLSILRGGGGMTNLALVERARAAEPDAFIVYRPHPDVEAGHRKGAIPDAVALAHVDHIERGGSLDALLERVHTLHTITSLSGFEALMRGVRVVVHGSPFYAGWGLTDDRGPPLPRRTRRLVLDELVAAALILYPRYLDARTGLPCTPEQFIDGIGGVGVDAGWLVRLRRWQGLLMRRLGAR